MLVQFVCFSLVTLSTISTTSESWDIKVAVYSEEVSVHISSSVSELTGVCVLSSVCRNDSLTDVQWLLAVRWSDKLLLLLAL